MNRGDCRTASATPGLVKIICYTLVGISYKLTHINQFVVLTLISASIQYIEENNLIASYAVGLELPITMHYTPFYL